jgi:hypothetical protein
VCHLCGFGQVYHLQNGVHARPEIDPHHYLPLVYDCKHKWAIPMLYVSAARGKDHLPEVREGWVQLEVKPACKTT